MDKGFHEKVLGSIDDHIVRFCIEYEFSISDFYADYFRRVENLKRVTIDHKEYDTRLHVMAYKGAMRNYTNTLKIMGEQQ